MHCSLSQGGCCFVVLSSVSFFGFWLGRDKQSQNSKLGRSCLPGRVVGVACLWTFARSLGHALREVAVTLFYTFLPHTTQNLYTRVSRTRSLFTEKMKIIGKAPSLQVH